MHFWILDQLSRLLARFRNRQMKYRANMQLAQTALDLIEPLRGSFDRLYRNGNYEVELTGYGRGGNHYDTAVICVLRVTKGEHHKRIRWTVVNEYNFYLSPGYEVPRLMPSGRIIDANGEMIGPDGIDRLLPMHRRFSALLGYSYGPPANATELAMLLGYLTPLTQEMEIKLS